MFRTALSRSSSLAARSMAASTGSMQVSMRFSALRGLASWPSHTVLSLPALSPTMESGGIAGWTLKEGDAINPGESICEVETDKATVDFEAQDEGFLAKILVPAGTSDVAVGTPIGVMVESESDIAAFKDFTAADAGAKPAASAEEPKKAAEEPKKPVEEPKKAAEAPKKPVEEPKKAAEPKPAVASQPAASQPNPPKTTAAKPKAKQSLPQMKSPLQAILEKAQSDYEKQYGITGLYHKKADKPAAASA